MPDIKSINGNPIKVDASTVYAENLDFFAAIMESASNKQGTYLSDVFQWEIGSIINGNNASSTTRCRTVGYISGKLFDAVAINAGYKAFAWVYNNEAGAGATTAFSWTTQTQTNIDPSKFYRLVIAKSDESSFSETVSVALTFQKNGNEGIVEANDRLDVLEDLLVTDLLSEGDIVSHSYYMPDGSVNNNFGAWSRTTLIDVKNIEMVLVGGTTSSGSTTSHVFFDDDEHFLGSVGTAVGTTTFQVPMGARYVGLTLAAADVGTAYAYGLYGNVGYSVPTVESYRALPSASKFCEAIVRRATSPTQVVDNMTWRQKGGLMWSDGTIWRRSTDNGLAITSDAYKTVKVSDGSEVSGFGVHTRCKLASITKLITSLTVERYAQSLSATLTLKSNEYIENNTNVIQIGDTVSYSDAIASGIVQSDNNAAYALARAVGYEIEPNAASDAAARAAFYAKMQETAELYGMTETDTFEHSAWGVFSTPNDICKLAVAINDSDSVIKTYWGLLQYTMSATGRTWTIDSTTTQAARTLIPEFVGGKTGTEQRVNTYVCIWENPNDHEQYATCVLDIDGWNSERFFEVRSAIDEVYELLGQSD